MQIPMIVDCYWKKFTGYVNQYISTVLLYHHYCYTFKYIFNNSTCKFARPIKLYICICYTLTKCYIVIRLHINLLFIYLKC